jgi:hypothetical protein
MLLGGSCHCGNVQLRLETAIDPRDLKLRACDCTFCRKHAVRSVMDPAGRAVIEVRDPAKLSRYGFGLRTAEFLICARCGAYAGAVLREGESAWAVLNANLFDELQGREAQPSSYGHETADSRIARRKAQWTPATVAVHVGASG